MLELLRRFGNELVAQLEAEGEPVDADTEDDEETDEEPDVDEDDVIEEDDTEEDEEPTEDPSPQGSRGRSRRN